MYSEHLYLLDMTTLLREQLEDAHDAGQVSEKVYQRERHFQKLLRAVILTDRLFSLRIARPETVCVFVPKNIHVLPLYNHDVYTGNHVEDIVSSTLAELHPSTLEVFTYKEPWIEVVAIKSSNLVRYTHHLTHGFSGGSSIPIVPLEVLLMNGNRAYFDTATRTLHLSTPLENDSFIVFEAITRMGMYDFGVFDAHSIEDAKNTELASVHLKAPADLESNFLALALKQVLKQPVNHQEVDAMVRGFTARSGPTTWEPERGYEDEYETGY